ncbi:MAG: RNA-binding S4 domain-containing protein [Lachnospiraceae bacterium]|nr:RNA-binding S4 domain-containing protein [Lachnospiraceae bacterium]
MTEISIRDDHIKLGQALKLSGEAGSGVDAKYMITQGLVKVNGTVCLERGRKLYKGDVISFDDKEYIIGGQ